MGRVLFAAIVAVLMLLPLAGGAIADDAALDPDHVPLVATIRQINRIDFRLEVSAVHPVGIGDGRADFAIEVAPGPDYWYQLGLASRTEISRTVVVSSSNEVAEQITFAWSSSSTSGPMM